MGKTKYIKGKDGRLAGSVSLDGKDAPIAGIGGKSRVDVAGPGRIPPVTSAPYHELYERFQIVMQQRQGAATAPQRVSSGSVW